MDVVGEAELAWVFLSQNWTFDDGVARPIERLRSGGPAEVLSAASGYGATSMRPNAAIGQSRQLQRR